MSDQIHLPFGLITSASAVVKLAKNISYMSLVEVCSSAVFTDSYGVGFIISKTVDLVLCLCVKLMTIFRRGEASERRTVLALIS